MEYFLQLGETRKLIILSFYLKLITKFKMLHFWMKNPLLFVYYVKGYEKNISYVDFLWKKNTFVQTNKQ